MNTDYSNIKNDNYTVQGLTIIDNLFFISAYQRNNYSRIYVYNNSGCLGKIVLNNKYHIGGISFDKKNNIIFVTGSATSIATYDYLKIRKKIKKNFVIDLNKQPSIIIKNNISTPFRAASLFIYKGYIYIVKFDINTRIAKVKYIFNKHEIKESDVYDLGIIDDSFCVQGICFYNNNLYLSSSLGPVKSILSIYNKNFELINRSIINQQGMEGIIIKNDTLYSVYEKGMPHISLHSLKTINQCKHKSILLKLKYYLSYKIYHKYKNKKH